MRYLYNNIVKSKSNIAQYEQLYKDRKDLVEPLVEGHNLQIQYKDYIVWRRKGHESNLINISNDGIRNSSGQFQIESDNSGILFFGGSTMFGYGVNDANTIPSLFHNITKEKVINYGETNYIARQSLSLYQNMMINDEFKGNDMLIISYDGANDVGNRCRSEIDFIETRYQNRIESKIQDKSKNFMSILDPWFDIFQKLNIGNIQDKYNCHTDQDKAIMVARTIVNNWREMDNIAKNHGHKFIAILQPLAFFGNPELRIDGQDGILAKQIKTVYPLILDMVNNENFKFVDMTKALDGSHGLSYYDYCHLDAKGNLTIVKEIAEKIKKLK